MSTPECILDAKAILGEGPVWDASQNVLWWVDITAGIVHRYDPETGRDTTRNVGQMVGTVAPWDDGVLVLGGEKGFALLDWESGEVTALDNPETDKPENRFNDGKMGPDGRFWAGTMAKAENAADAALYSLDRDGGITRALAGVTVSNGLCWSADAGTFYYVDSPTRRVDAFDFDVASGQLSNRRTLARFPDSHGFPDGMTIDAAGTLWIAFWDGWKIRRLDSATGQEIGSIDFPVARVTSCFFGPDEKVLYATSARTGISDEELAKQPQAGGLFRVVMDT